MNFTPFAPHLGEARSTPASKKKGQEPLPIPALFVRSELVEHRPMHRVHYTRC